MATYIGKLPLSSHHRWSTLGGSPWDAAGRYGGHGGHSLAMACPEGAQHRVLGFGDVAVSVTRPDLGARAAGQIIGSCVGKPWDFHGEIMGFS